MGAPAQQHGKRQPRNSPAHMKAAKEMDKNNTKDEAGGGTEPEVSYLYTSTWLIRLLVSMRITAGYFQDEISASHQDVEDKELKIKFRSYQEGEKLDST